MSAESEKELFDELKSFPNNIDQRFYSDLSLDEQSYIQGDGVNEMLIVELPELKTKQAPAIIISNSCDISAENSRKLPTRICYSPLLSLKKVVNSLKTVLNGLFKVSRRMKCNTLTSVSMRFSLRN